MMDSTFGAQTTDVLQKGTVWLTVAFFGAAILLTILNTRYYESQRDVGNILEDVQKPEAIPSFPGLGAPAPADSKAPAPKADAPAKSDAKSETPKAAKDAKSKAENSEPAKPATKTPAAKADAGKEKPAESKAKKADAPAKTDAAKSAAGEKDKK